MMRVISAVWEELTTPQRFERDWYKWTINQISHIGAGIGAVWLLCFTFYLAVGDLPYRSPLFVSILSVYVVFEIRAQRWAGWDTIEDVIFVCIYGAGGTLYTFAQVAGGGPDVAASIMAPAPFFFAASVHLAAGILHRLRRAQND